jgi:hypothetical protein
MAFILWRAVRYLERLWAVCLAGIPGFDRLSPNGLGLLGKLHRGFDKLSLNGVGLTGITRYRTNLTPFTLRLSLAQRPGGDRVRLKHD